PGYAADLSALDTLFGKPNLIVPEATAPPEIDGSLSDPAWQKAPRAFMVRNDARGKPKQDTWLKVVSDDDHLYVAVHCAENRMERLRANVKETDGPLWSDDSLEMFIDPGHKEDFSYYQFIFNAIGTAHHTKAGDKSWTPRSLKIANRKLAQAWTLELKIAFADLVGEAPLPKLWGFNLMRVRYPKMGTEIPKGEKAIEFLRNMNFEESAWSPTLTTTSHVPFRFGQLYLKGGEVEPNILKRLAMKKSLKPDGAFPVTAKNLNRIYGGPSVLIPQVNRAPDIDGKLNDTAWRKAEPLSFSTNSGGKSAVHRTIARTVTDPESIYFAFQCFDREV
ncbi:MAG: sugar-binding protein, partial [Planctomycetota bacterium]|nr:sugar-binding protein [Planctomycetota bacterium]